MEEVIQQMLDNQSDKGSMQTRATTKSESVHVPLIQEVSSEIPDTTSKVSSEDFQSKLLSDYQRELEERKQEELKFENQFKNTNIRSYDTEKIMCLAVDGHETSDNAFNIIIKEFIDRLNTTLMCVHIYNNVHNEEYNWKHQKLHIIEKYNTNLITHLTEEKGHLVIQDRNPSYRHPIEQVSRIAIKNECNFFCLGFQGLKTQNFKMTNIRLGVDYLLRESKMPTIIFKEKYCRGIKNKGYKWLIVMDRASSDCFKVFDFFYPLMDIKKDEIHGLTLLPKYVKFDDIKKQFHEKMKEINIDEEQIFYEMLPYVARPSEIVKPYVNKNDDNYYDFVVFYNNPDQYRAQGVESENLKMVEKLQANICFVNGVYMNMVKLEMEKEEQRRREEEEEKKKKEEQ